ncbi:MAG: sigma-70 family RNA polymerase sigma factor [Myxococcales bacterium]|nr:sigma-70 family RNA polymerase sigma factor [Myxococcales bacterium]MCB9648254.1 sigma-70 family RNA polymerase sigma factor [Deltaproteobacteria bacterium]
MELTPSLYGHLRAIAGSYFRAQSSNHTLQPTALVNEAFIKLSGSDAAAFVSREHFVSVAARAMRQILVDHARAKAAAKRGGGIPTQTLTEVQGDGGARIVDLIALDSALNALAELDPRHAQVVELRYFGGLSVPEIAETLEVSVATIERDWKKARAWLVVHLEDIDAS